MATQVAPPVPSIPPMPEDDDIPDEIREAAENAEASAELPLEEKKTLSPAEQAEYEALLKKMTPLSLWNLMDQLKQANEFLKLNDKYMPVRGTITFYDERGAQIRIEQSGVTIANVLTLIVNGSRFAHERFGFSSHQPNLIPKLAPAAVSVSASAPAVPGAPVVPGANAASSVPGSNGGSSAPVDSIQQFNCAFMKVLPQSNGKTKIEFYGNDRKQPRNEFPTLVIQNTPQALAAAFKNNSPEWTDAHFTSAWETAVNFPVAWKYGKVNENSKKEPKDRYKDFVAVYPFA